MGKKLLGLIIAGICVFIAIGILIKLVTWLIVICIAVAGIMIVSRVIQGMRS